jgi:hypothetical protein
MFAILRCGCGTKVKTIRNSGCATVCPGCGVELGTRFLENGEEIIIAEFHGDAVKISAFANLEPCIVDWVEE